jgi:hypothetical protein
MKKVYPVYEATHNEAREFFLRPSVYSTIELPEYFDFSKVLSECDSLLRKKNDSPNAIENVLGKLSVFGHDSTSYRILITKDGQYQWRYLDLINPLLYVDLVNLITSKEHWSEIQNVIRSHSCNDFLVAGWPLYVCKKQSLKKSAILSWWKKYEQESISTSLEYQFMATTDISACYNSIYTHSIDWAIRGKSEAKANPNDQNALGHLLDLKVSALSGMQTNGIPQGSEMMDFIAEIVLSYADSELYKNLQKKFKFLSYKIIRFRDDYRIFTNVKSDLSLILRELALVLSDLNLSLNASKTKTTDDPILLSMKQDKLDVVRHPLYRGDDFEKQLIALYCHSQQYPNSGSVLAGMKSFYQDLKHHKKSISSQEQIISLIVNIMYRNPKIIRLCVATLSEFFDKAKLTAEERLKIIKTIERHYEGEPNCEYVELWLQRLSLSGADRPSCYDTKLCKIVCGDSLNSPWDFGFVPLESRTKIVRIKSSSIVNSEGMKDYEKPIPAEDPNSSYPIIVD